MHILLLGTGAADIHAPDRCSCANCALVRQRGGRSRRTYTSSLFDGELLLDCGPTVPGQLGLLCPEVRVRRLVFTHPDGDHFDVDAVEKLLSEHVRDIPLAVVGSPPVMEILRHSRVAGRLELHPVSVLESIHLGPWRVTALPARHRGSAGDSLIYLLKNGAETVLYATDTGPLLDRAWDALLQTHLTAVIAEATFGPETDGIPDLETAHMNFPLLCELRTAMLAAGIIDAGTPFIATHLSLHHCPPHEETSDILARCGIRAGYDGMRLDTRHLT